jgi:hypothetical protein
MSKFSYHPNAFLNQKRNIQPGLSARTQIITFLEKQQSSTKKISVETGLNYNVVLYHLHLLEREKILKHRGTRVYIWELTGSGQQTLLNIK